MKRAAGTGSSRLKCIFCRMYYVPCEVCKGKRYNRGNPGSTIQREKHFRCAGYDGRRGHRSSLKIFPESNESWKPYMMWALAYVKLGQSSTTLSGGEAQRVKLATELSSKKHRKNGLYPGRTHHGTAYGGCAQADPRCCKS